MTKLAYLECPTGIAGDMCLGALVDAGVPLEYLINKLKALSLAGEYQLRAQTLHRNGQLATKVYVDLSADHHHDEYTHHHGRHLPEIERLITAARLPPRAEAWSLAVFRRLAEAEGAVHGIPPDQVHFHEVGAVDAIVDIVGTCLGLDWLGIESNQKGLPLLYCSPLPTGGGTISAAHGVLAVPVPAVLKLWEMRGCPIYSNGIERELVTPTGAAIATALATDFGSPPAMILQRVGLGAGSRDLPIPNILRLWLGEPSTAVMPLATTNAGFKQAFSNLTGSPSLEAISVLETQIDDLSPQAIGYVFEALFAAGAVDVFTQPVGMKKSRPGILLTVICHPEQLLSCETVLFRETTTLGIRRSTQQRAILQRETQQVETEYGVVHVKVAWMGNDQEMITNVQPEYEDCATLARQHNLSWRKVHQLALHNWYLEHNSVML